MDQRLAAVRRLRGGLALWLLAVVALSACGPSWAGVDAGATARERELVALGGELFGDTCGACHGRDGRGKTGIAPTLHQSPWVTGPDTRLVRIMFDGVSDGPAAERFQLPMARWRILDDRQIAALASYVRRSWGHHQAIVDPETVGAIRRETADRTRPWTRVELSSIP
ncbi:MAG: c-type cytochrome [Vicinamibacterales bacterium]